MTSTNEDNLLSPSSPGVKGSSRSSKRKKERDSSSKAKEKSRRARDHPPTSPGAVPSSSSSRLERKKEKSSGGKRSSSTSADNSRGRKSRSSSAVSKPGVVSSTGRDRSKKGSSRSNKSSHRPSSSKASSGSSSIRSPRPSEEKHLYLAANTPNRGPSIASSANEMESGLVAEAVDDTEMKTTSNALRDKNRENEALRRELQRTREEQASKSRRRGIPFWAKVCLGSLILIGAVVWAVIAFTGGGGGDAEAMRQPANILNSTYDPTSEPTGQATTVVPTDSPTTGPDGKTVFDPPTTRACSKISEGLPVDGQEAMSMQPLSIKMDVYLLFDISKDLWLPEMLQNIQQLLMPPVVGCGNTTLDWFPVGNAQVDQNNATWISCEDQTNGPCCTVIFPANIFLKKDVVSYDLEDLNQRVEGVFQTSKSLVVNAQDEKSKAIKDIGSVTSVPTTPSPSQQLSSNLIVTSIPSTSPSSQPTMPSTSGATTSPTAGPIVTPESGPTLAPSSAPSLGPTLFPTSGPTRAPVPGITPPPSPLPPPGPTAPPSPPPTRGPSMAPTPAPSDSPSRAPSTTPTVQPSAAPTSKCMRLEATLSRFAPFDGNKGQALDWLCSTDTWEPPIDATDETSLWEERFALAVFYYATSGDSWTNNDGWLTSAGACSWTGIILCNGDDSVIKFQISDLGGRSYGLVGDFPDEMRALAHLEHISFGYNKDLQGAIPSFLTSLTQLTHVALGDTGRTGSIPSELWILTKLQILDLWGNYLTGMIPSGISAMAELVRMSLQYNDLSGSLPDEFGGMVQLTRLNLNENKLDGTVPPFPSSLTICALAKEDANWIHYISRKTEGNCFTDTTNAPGGCNLSANQCQLEATLSRFAPFDGNKALALDWLKADTWEPPSSATDETSQSLWAERFALAVFYYATSGDGWSNNDGWLTSADVCSWTGIDDCNGDGSVTKFQLLIQSGSSYGLVGNFPDEMRALSNLEHLNFAYNKNLSGSIPSFLTVLTELTYLGITDTGRIGSIPSELWTLTTLQKMYLTGNYLTGTIPSGFSALTELVHFHIQYNDFSGSLPDEFEGMTQLTSLVVNENYLGGTIPPLASSVTSCWFAKEDPNWIHYVGRKTEGNCFTDTTNAPTFCNLSANQCQLEATLSRFAPFDGNKGQALEWLKADTWEPPADATDETSQSLWEERFVLAVYYYAINGDGWTNNNAWLTSASVCSWYDITGCNGDGSVTNFKLSYSRSTGLIPSELWALTNLQELELWANYLTGTIPSGISALTELTKLSLSYNDLTGSLPDEFGSMTQLAWLSVQHNYLEGAVPPLPSSLATCSLVYEGSGSWFRPDRLSEGNCFTDTANAFDNNCNLIGNCPP